ncbi:MAG: hypothetical protein OXD49_05815 [Candidatus Poribacteria bacterium]|nr:hypothetical protein [Candidatus Poribacteria bacterium]
MSNVAFGRTPNKRVYLAQRIQDGFKAVDTTHPLAQTIISGWEIHSPIDSLVISPELKLMGRQDANRLRGDSRDRGLSEAEGYRLFLSEALSGKRPGSGKIVLPRECPSVDIMDTFQTPMIPHQDYTVVEIDTTAFENGGTLTLDIGVGRGKAAGAFYLFDGDKDLPTEKAPEGVPTSVWESQVGEVYLEALEALAMEWYIGPEETGKITYPFDEGKLFCLCVTGSPYSAKGSRNAFSLKIFVS